MENNKFTQNIHPLLAKFNTLCPECNKRIFAGEPVIFLSDFKVTLHWGCFYQCNVLSFETDLLTSKQSLIIDPKFSLKTQFCILIYRLKRKAKHNVNSGKRHYVPS